jgi:hypothetical protein
MVKSETHVIEEIDAIMSRTGISYSEVAASCRVAPTTVRWTLTTRKLPARQAAAAAMRRFVSANAKAQSRTDIRFA